jgi:phosphopantetheinyl transferase
MGKPVLPGVMGMEFFAETAKLLRPELDVIGMKDVEFFKAVNIPDNAEVTVTAEIVDDDELEKSVRIRFTSRDSKKDKEVVNYTGFVIMGKGDDACRIHEGHPIHPESVMAQILKDEVYQHLFHGQLFQVTGAIEVLSEDQLLGILRVPDGSQFDPNGPWKDGDLVTAPLQTELGFQVAGAYTLDRFDMMALPVKVGRIDYSSMMRTDEKAFAWVKFNGREENVFSFDVEIIDTSGNVRFTYRDFCLKGLMTNKVDMKGDHSFQFEEVSSPNRNVRVFRLDSDNFTKDLDDLRTAFTKEEWEGLFTEKMTAKRKREHALGRVITKLGTSWYLGTERFEAISLSAIKIEVEENGKPFAVHDGERIEISISHSHRWAVCSVSKKVHGVDIELAEPRDMSFADEAFHPSEKDLLTRIQEEMDIGEPLAQTLLFSSKEAYLKMKGLGLKADLKEVLTGEVIKVPARAGLGFELLINHSGDEARVEAHIASAYVLTVCSV